MNLTCTWQIYRIRSALAGNQLIYWLGRVPLLKRVFTDKLYSAGEGKLVLSILVTLYRGVRALLGKAIYLAVIWLVPLALSDMEVFSQEAFSTSVWIFFWLSFVAGTMMQPISVQPSQLKYTCVRQMGMDAAEYQKSEILTSHLSAFAGFTPFLLLWAGLTGAGVFQGLLLSLALAGVRMVAEWFHLALYAKFHRVPSAKAMYILALVVACLAAAFVPMSFGAVPDLAQYLLYPATVTLLVAVGCLCARVIARYPHHYELILDTCQAEKISGEAAKKKASSVQFEQVKLRDSDLDTKGDFSRLHGWKYLQAVFFHRHRRMLLKPVVITVGIVAALTVLGCGGILWLGLQGRGEEMVEVFSRVTRALPMCVFLLYLMDNTVGERICKAMFYNCDLALLRYGWYRERDAILKNFFLRWRMLSGVNLLLSGTVCGMFVLLTVLAGGRPPVGEFILFLLALLSLGVFFATHSLALYYLFQPYTSELDTKNPMFKLLNFLMYVVCYAALQVKSTPTWFALLVFGVTVVYSVVMLVLVLRRAPKTFRVK
ncbi:hypothetical protein H9X86_07500 [Pseudoflavonifractor capillosus]|uniref:hypothetical protein n=1 Tax=Pseudoflavonifractor capillosus TaxID=106588 RepID=UPI00195AD6A4|nr:hypothetical protein [Pseudoflavonifractor capillosus]MBM6897215.1 hypothetical protein [Pseudoflavonifractor capillosus]